MITIDDYFMGRREKYPQDVTPELAVHVKHTVDCANELLTYFGSDRKVNSGWRPKSLQMEINPRAPNSKHITGDAIDIEDKDGKLKNWCMDNGVLLAALGLYMEHPSSTPTWLHVQTVAPKSGKIVFYP
jgi:hypothetical protein